ncbi:hypothetical protein K4K52_012356 [Colletotrichum sp. SAR 10_76]|nr:hypothetical protein K4K52_012356 [Colletotrichum sp. SAR 10_76]
MAPISVLLNSNVSDDKGLQVFYVTDQDNLGVSLKNSAKTGVDSQDVYVAAADGHAGLIPVKSEIGTAVMNGLNLVVAVTKHKLKTPTETPTLNDVSIVSPVYQVLDTTAITNTTAAISSNKENNNAWVYYLKGSDAGQLEINEYELTTGNIGTVPNLNIDPDCSLGAFYDSSAGRRSIIYQDKAQGHIKEYQVESGQTIDIGDSAGAKSNTSLAVAYFDEHVYLYYTDQFMNLYRIIKDKSNGWGQHKKLTPGTNPDPSSQLTAIGANGIIHLFYQAQNNKKITHYRDTAFGN